ncbi:YceI family protein [Fodinibius salsisoli]|uniref:YceI family protein n=1 Tax=Fodinibius salsisoli TaxID=2820877 RepID=A0ABT3PP31_9BACT|nr:YceI family protein [Fodinibius salsisoli]MCW9707615.1 YceI family protein [Fodinibius salsisoli]
MNSYKRNISLLLAVLFVTASAFIPVDVENPSNATAWSIDKAHSNISFSIRHIFTPITGEFKEYDANVMFDPDNLEESSIDIEIQVSSIDTDVEKRDGHLQSDDFFSVAEYPTITFSSDQITVEGDNEFIAHGELTIKDVTKEVELPFTLLGVQDHPMQENTKVAGVTIDYQLNRNDFNVGAGDWASTAIIGGEVDLNIDLEMTSPAN